MDIGLVIFDCDGVLIDSEVLAVRTLIEELQRVGVGVDEAFVHRWFLGRSFPVVQEVIERRFGVVLPSAFEADQRARLVEVFTAELRAMPGVADTLRDLRVSSCLATSSTPERLARSLEITGLAPLFAGRCFTASQVRAGKPAPDLFLFAAEAMGVSPDRCLVIEDAEPGLVAARRAGMQVWRFTGGSHFHDPCPPEPPEARPDRRFRSFSRFFDGAPCLRRTPCEVQP